MRKNALFAFSVVALLSMYGCSDESSRDNMCPKEPVCDGDTLIYCSHDIEKFKGCTYGCANGACINETSESELCLDKSCPEGETCDPNTGDCVEGTEQPCDSGKHFDEEKQECVEDETHACEAGQHWDEASEGCVSDETHDCEAGQHWDEASEKCVSDGTHDCEAGQHWDKTSEKCVKNKEENSDQTCPEGQDYDETVGNCVPVNQCGTGKHYDENESKCVDDNPDSQTCSSGQTYDVSLGKCIKTCDENSIYDEAQSKCVDAKFKEFLSTYEKHQTALQETAMAFYRRGSDVQYESHRRSDYIAPEDITSQKLEYMVCSSFVYAIYYQTFGIELPNSTNKYNAYGNSYNKENKDIVFFIGKEDLKKSLETEESQAKLTKDILEKLEIGDLITYYNNSDSTPDGHIVFVYKIISDAQGNRTNATILHATSNFENTADRTTKLTQSLSWNAKINTEDKVTEGAIQKTDLLALSESWKGATELTVLRPIANDKNYKHIVYSKTTSSSYPDWKGDDYVQIKDTSYTLTEAAKSRLKYNGIQIEKTVDVFNGSTVVPGDALTYTINITNRGSEGYKDLSVVENISEFVTATELGDGAQSSDKKSITWNIDELKAGSSKTITYIVTVNDKTKGKTITSTGKVANIRTGTLTNYIANSLTTEEINKLKTAFDKHKANYKGIELIQKTYLEALNVTIDFDDFVLGVLYAKNDTNESVKKRLDGKPYYQKDKVISLLTSYYGNTFSDFQLEPTHKLASMVYNNYYSGVYTSYPATGDSVYQQKTYENSVNAPNSRSPRQNMIYPETIRPGDILLYTNTNDEITHETGMYAFIYLGDKFQGVNSIVTGNNKTQPLNELKIKSGTVPEKFKNLGQKDMITRYGDMPKIFGKDFYVILRPALVM